jgi:hypothetical protein
MNKNERLEFLQNLVKKNASGVLNASAPEIEEEKKLALSNVSDDSILDEEDSNSFVSPALAVKLDTPRVKREMEEESVLSKADMKFLEKELGRPISFLGVKRSIEKQELSVELPSDIDLNELSDWAKQQAQATG